MATKKEKLKARFESLLGLEKPAVIDEAMRDRVAAALAPVSAHMLRDLLRDCGCPLAPLVEGVRQDDLPQLERTLLSLAQEYRDGDARIRRAARDLVIEAKDHARLVTRNTKADPAKRLAKEEMLLWMLTWLENPGVFEMWVGLRKAAIAAQSYPLE
ncbi:MAG: hypothetical protein JNL98_28580 [Bryobacterales bacterium]|nr:hypothetical protein [Bryobacterales bacterium]